MNGLDEMRGRIPQSEIFYEAFAEKHMHRDLLTTQQITFLQGELSGVIEKLAPYFQEQSCHKILEMLIRFYNVQVYCVNELMSSFFVYHDSKFFIRLLQICSLTGTDWEMLENYKKEGQVIQRKHVIKRCLNDMKLFSIILELSLIHI